MAVAARPLTWVPSAIPAQPHDSSSAVIIAVIPGSAACPPSGTPVRPICSGFGGDIPGEFVALVVFPSDGADLFGGELVRGSLHKAVGFGQ